MMEKYETSARNIFCDFCNFVGHDIHNFYALELMRNHIMVSYRMQEGHDGMV